MALLAIQNAHAQLTYVDVDWSIDQSVIMPDGQTDIMEFDIDEDGTNDLRITSWSNHTTGIETVVEVLLLSASLYEGLDVDNCNSLVECFGGLSDPSINGYIYSSDCSNPSNEYLKFPFEFTAGDGHIHCGFLYVRYQGTSIIFEGYAWNEGTSSCSCSTSGWLSLEEPEPTEDQGTFEYYTLLGQKTDNPQGLVLKVYESGRTEKVFML